MNKKYQQSIIKATEEIQKRGTLIVSFIHDGTLYKNVTLGSNRAIEVAARLRITGEVLGNRMLICNADEKWLLGISNNQDHAVRMWNLKDIEKFSAIHLGEKSASLFEKLAFWFKYNVALRVKSVFA